MILIDFSSALRLNEIESNPEGRDSGEEWVELYSESMVSLDGYYLENGDGGVINLSGSFVGYIVITFQTLWLDNTNESVMLKSSGNIVDSALSFSDNKKNKTYSRCDSGWMFDTESKNGENLCGNEGSTNTNPNTNNNNEEEQEEEPEEIEEKVTYEPAPPKNNSITPLSNPSPAPKKITLASKKETGEITRTYKTRVGVIYFFIGLSVLLVILIAMRKL